MHVDDAVNALSNWNIILRCDARSDQLHGYSFGQV